LRLIGAVHEVTAAAVRALAAVPAEEAKTDAIALLPGRDARANGVDDTDDLVAGDDGHAGIGPHAFDAENIAVAHPAAQYPHAAWPYSGSTTSRSTSSN
jgi:hypothetical protein